MHVFVAGGTGAIGTRLIPQLVERGHRVTATTRDPAKLAGLDRLGAHAVVVDGLDSAGVGEAVASAEPDAVVHQMSSLAGKLDPKHFDRSFALTNRLRTQGLDHLVAAAQATGVQHIVAQSYTGWPNIRAGGWVKDEEDPLDPEPPKAQRESLAAIRYVEETMLKVGGTALRYGGFYGGAGDPLVAMVRKRQFPLVGGGPGYIWTSRQAPPSSRGSSGRGACSTSSTTSPPRPVSGCRIWPRARGRSLRCGCRCGWPGSPPVTSPSRC